MQPIEATTGTCPNCDRKTRRDELHVHKGVCRHCFASFKTAHRGWNFGSHREQRAVEAHALPETADHCHADFDWRELETALGEIEREPADAREQAAEALERIFSWAWQSGSPHAALMKFTSFCSALKPGLVNRTQPELAAFLGVSKAVLSKHTRNAQAVFNVKFTTTRNNESCERMREAQLKIRASGRRKVGQRGTPPTPRLVKDTAIQ